MPAQSGYFSWVCFIDVQKGAWFGPIAQDKIEDYEYGFTLDDNIKSWTEFTYYDEAPTDPLTCNFSKRVLGKKPRAPKTITFAECVSSHLRGHSSKGTRDVAVHASVGWWQATGIQVGKDMVVTIEQINPNERWCTHPDKGPTDADGCSQPGEVAQYPSLVVGVQFGGLVACIRGGSRAVWIGTKGIIHADVAGELLLGANDDLNGYGDNWGAITFRVTWP